jgi:hypothetical protein
MVMQLICKNLLSSDSISKIAATPVMESAATNESMIFKLR